MRKTAFALAVLAMSSLTFAQSAPTPDAFKQKFSADEQWLLAVVLSDDKQKASFDAEAAAAAAPADQDRFMLRWRKKVAGVASEYKKLLAADIVPNAPSIEKMVSENEFNLMNYWLMYQPKERQKQIMSDISLGNAVLSFRRGDVEGKIQENRKAAALAMDQYMASPAVVAARAYQDAPPPKPAKAIDQLKDAEEKARQAKDAPTREQGAEKADKNFSGKDDPTPTTTPSSRETASKPNLINAPPGAVQGGITFRPPPTPMLDREKPTKQSTIGVLAKKILPAVGGGLLGGILGFLLGGPIGAIIGAAIGGYAGYKAGQALLE